MLSMRKLMNLRGGNGLDAKDKEARTEEPSVDRTERPMPLLQIPNGKKEYGAEVPAQSNDDRPQDTEE